MFIVGNSLERGSVLGWDTHMPHTPRLSHTLCTKSLRWLAVSLLVLGISTAAGTVRAALQSGDFQARALSQLMPRSPVIDRVQVLLKEFDIYTGPVDGRMNDELSAAVKHYQTISGLAPDGRINEELLAHIEFKGQAQRLLARLEEVSENQRDIARKQLRQSSVTRSLVDHNQRNIVADPTRDPTICYDAPTVTCLITEAIEAAKAVHRRHFRDWVYGEIAIVQARARMPDAARASAGSIDDPRLIIKTLRNIAQVQAETDQLDAAAVSAGIVPDQWSRMEALTALAGGQARAGDWPAARQLTTDILAMLNEVNDERPKTALLGELAGALAAAGDQATALLILQDEARRVLDLSNSPNATARVYRLSTLSTAYSDLDRPIEGRAHLPDAIHAVQRRTALIALARAEARAAHDAVAAEVAAELSEAQYRAVALADIGRIQMAAGRAQVARGNLDEAISSAEKINSSRKFSRAHAIDRISDAWLAGGFVSESENTAGQIGDAKLRAFAFARIGQFNQAQGNALEARRLFQRMDAVAAKISSPLDRVWMYANASLYLAARGNSATALGTFNDALKIVRHMTSSWARAQALVRLVSALGGLSKTGVSPLPKE